MPGIAGAASVLGVDASELGVAQARENAELNGLSDRVTFQCADVFDLLPELEQKGEKFDVVILDPPAFTKSRSSIKNAVKGYREINLRGMKLVKDGGYLATCSCSHFMDPELFTKTIREAAANVHKRLRQVEYRTQATDHPILWTGGEQASYCLKFYIFRSWMRSNNLRIVAKGSKQAGVVSRCAKYKCCVRTMWLTAVCG